MAFLGNLDKISGVNKLYSTLTYDYNEFHLRLTPDKISNLALVDG